MEQRQHRPEDYLSFAVILLILFTFPVWITPLFEVLYAFFETIGARQSGLQTVLILAPITIAIVAYTLHQRRKYSEGLAPLQLTRQERIKKRRVLLNELRLYSVIIGVALVAFWILLSSFPNSYQRKGIPYFIWFALVIRPVIVIAMNLHLLSLLNNAVLIDDENGTPEDRVPSRNL